MLLKPSPDFHQAHFTFYLPFSKAKTMQFSLKALGLGLFLAQAAHGYIYSRQSHCIYTRTNTADKFKGP